MIYPIYEMPYELWFTLPDYLPYMKGALRMVINSTIHLYVGAGLDEFGLTKPFTTNLPSGLLSFFNFLLSLQLLA